MFIFELHGSRSPITRSAHMFCGGTMFYSLKLSTMVCLCFKVIYYGLPML